MAVAVQTVATTAFGSRSSISINKPSGTVDGDLLVAVITAFASGQTINSVPSGWTLLANESNSVTYVYYKVASSEGSSYSFGFTGTATCAGGIMRIDGQDDSTPTDQSNTDYVFNDETPSFASSTITPSSANGMLVMVISAYDNLSSPSVTGYAIATDNPSWTEQWDLSQASTFNPVFSVATASRPETSATGNASCTITNGDPGVTDVGCILFNIQVEADAQVTLDTITVNQTLQAPTIVGGASVSLDTINVNETLQEPTITPTDSLVTNRTKNSATNITNRNKS